MTSSVCQHQCVYWHAQLLVCDTHTLCCCLDRSVWREHICFCGVWACKAAGSDTDSLMCWKSTLLHSRYSRLCIHPECVFPEKSTHDLSISTSMLVETAFSAQLTSEIICISEWIRIFVGRDLMCQEKTFCLPLFQQKQNILLKNIYFLFYQSKQDNITAYNIMFPDNVSGKKIFSLIR